MRRWRCWPTIGQTFKAKTSSPSKIDLIYSKLSVVSSGLLLPFSVACLPTSMRPQVIRLPPCPFYWVIPRHATHIAHYDSFSVILYCRKLILVLALYSLPMSFLGTLAAAPSAPQEVLTS